VADGTEPIKAADELASQTELRLPSTLASVETVETMALAYAQQSGFEPELCSHLAMVAREAAVNAVVHGNKYATDKQVTARFELRLQGLWISIADEGEGLDVAAIPDPLAPENLLRSSGRGIFLMRSFMDEVSFRSLSPGTETTLIKRRTGPQKHLTE
jgi:serine/threonine-protein kinase RsbW